MGINSGPANAIKILQRGTNTSADGILGKNTIRAVEDTEFNTNDYSDARVNQYNKMNPRFRKGWTKRANTFREDIEYPAEELGFQVNDNVIGEQEHPDTIDDTLPTQNEDNVTELQNKLDTLKQLREPSSVEPSQEEIFSDQQQLYQPEFAEGGTVEQQVEEFPTDYQGIMTELQKREDAFKLEKQDARKQDAMTDVAKAIGDFGSKQSAAQAQIAGGMQFRAPKSTMKEGTAEKSLVAPNLKEYLQKVQMMKQLKDLKSGGSAVKSTKIQTVNDQGEAVTQMVHPVSGDLVKEFKTPKKEITPYQTETLKLWKSGIETKETSAEQNRTLRELKEEQRKEEKKKAINVKANENIYRVTKDFEGNSMKKALDKQGMSFEEMNELTKLIRTGNQIALGGIGVKAARAMGEVGVLTDTDVQRYIEAQSIMQKLKDKHGRLTKGMLSKKTLKDLDQVNNKMLEGFAKRESRIYKTYMDRAYENFGKQAGFSREEIAKRFGMGYKTVAPKTYSVGQLKKAAAKSFGGDIEQAKAFYESKGYRSE